MIETHTKSLCCIIGAGYSAVAGLPLAKDLFSSNVVVVSKGAKHRFELVWNDYEKWQQENPSKNPEEYLAALYNNVRSWPAPPFACAVELVAAVLATPRGYDVKPINPRYGVRITQPSKNAIHTAFWMAVTEMFTNMAVVTTNYDLLIERSLRHRPMKRGFGPGYYYGGLNRPQILEGTTLPFSVKNTQRFVELTGTIPLYKLHGSLNWAKSIHGLELYQDMRPAFRNGNDAAIIPPVPEKTTPEWLKSIWKDAERVLAQSHYWIVCGYSLPSYDTSIQDVLKRASTHNLEKIFILDPYSEHLRDRYNQVAPNAELYCLAGLPNGIEQLHNALATSGGGSNP